MIWIIPAYFFIVLTDVLNLLLPDWTIPSKYMEAIKLAIDQSLLFNNIFPVYELYKVFGFLLFFELMLFIINSMTKFLTIARGGGSGTDY